MATSSLIVSIVSIVIAMLMQGRVVVVGSPLSCCYGMAMCHHCHGRRLVVALAIGVSLMSWSCGLVMVIVSS